MSPSRVLDERSASKTGGDRRVSLHGCAGASRTALRLSPDLPFDSWERLGSQIFLITDSSNWWLADWLVYGQARFGQRYREAIDLTHLEYQTLRNYAWVARKFVVSRRRDTVSFHHHAEVAALTAKDQDMWLDRAVIFGWSRTELRRQLRATRAQQGTPVNDVVHVVTIRVALARRDRWAKAAARREQELSDWICELLDRAAEATPAEPDTEDQVAHTERELEIGSPISHNVTELRVLI